MVARRHQGGRAWELTNDLNDNVNADCMYFCKKKLSPKSLTEILVEFNFSLVSPNYLASLATITYDAEPIDQ